MEIDEISFLNHINSLNIGTVDVSFGWLLDSGNEVLNWFYKNVNKSNCLTPQEKARYAELQDSGSILDDDAVELEVRDICQKYQGIAEPWIEEKFHEDHKELADLEEMISLLQEQEETKNKMILRHKKILASLSSEHNRCKEDLKSENMKYCELSKECEDLLNQVKCEKLQYFISIGETLKSWTSSKKPEDCLFFCEKPLHTYFEKTKLLSTYLKLYVSRQCEESSRNDNASVVYNILHPRDDTDLNKVKVLEKIEKLEESLLFYVKTKSNLTGALEQIKYLQNYDVNCCYDLEIERQKNITLVEILSKDVGIFSETQILLAIEKLVNQQAEDLLMGELQLKLEKTKFVHEKLCAVAALAKQALNENDLLHVCLKREQLAVQDFLNFSIDTMNHLQSEISAHKLRSFDFVPLKDGSYVLKQLYKLFDLEPEMPVSELVRTVECLLNDVASMEKNVFHKKLSQLLQQWQKSIKCAEPMKDLIFDGPTDLPNICNEELGMAVRDLSLYNGACTEKIDGITKSFTDFKKNLDSKQGLNMDNLWMWFLSDPASIRLFKEKHELKKLKPIKAFK